MKKIALSLSLLCLGFSGQSQVTSAAVDLNNAIAIINNNGTFFSIPGSQNPGYLIPAASGIGAIQFMNISISSINVNGQQCVLTADGTNSDFRPGPVADNYQNTQYVNRFSQSVWGFDKQTILDHITHWNDPGYIVPTAIEDWPGNGNVANGEAAVIAPFFDVDNDQIYEPEDGDYPEIRGDKAVFIILRSLAGPSCLNLEVHLMLYQYASEDTVLNNTTFLHCTYINRGLPHSQLNIGNYINFDLGYDMDDYAGCDPGRNLAYCYNGDAYDEDDFNMNLLGYGTTPPAIGIKLLNQQLTTHVVNSSTFPSHNELGYLLNGLTINGSPIIHPDGQPTKLVYDDLANGEWNEVDLNSEPNNRKTVISFRHELFETSEAICADYAFIYAESQDTGLKVSAEQLLLVADQIQGFYDQQTYTCSSLLSVGKEKLPALVVYPNPADQFLTIESPYPLEVTIFSSDGKRMITSDGPVSSLNISGLQPGCYFLKTSDERIIRFIKL